jgi:transposase
MPKETTLCRLGDKDRENLGKDCIHLHEEHGLSWPVIAERKGVAYNTVRRWAAEAKEKIQEPPATQSLVE